MASSLWSPAQVCCDDEDRVRVHHVLPVDRDDDEPLTAAPTYVPVLAEERELTPAPSWVPEPATSPSDGKHPTTQGVLEKFKALGIQPRTGSKKGEHRGAAKTKRASTKTKAGSKAKSTPKELAVKRPRGRPRKNAAAAPVISRRESEDEEEPDVASGGDSEEESVPGLVSDEEVEEEEDGVSLEDDSMEDTMAGFVSGDETEEDEAVDLASIGSDSGAAVLNIAPSLQEPSQPQTARRRSTRQTSPAHYRDLTAQEADVFEADEHRAMCGSDSTSESGEDSPASNGEEVEDSRPDIEVVNLLSSYDDVAFGAVAKEAEVVDLVSDGDKENEPPTDSRRSMRRLSRARYRDMTAREADGILSREDRISHGLDVDEEERDRDVRREPLAVAARPRRQFPQANYRDLTRREADHLQAVDHVTSLSKKAKHS